MADRLNVYKCEVCGILVEVLHGGAGTLTCCDQPMQKLDPQTADSSVEKHVPVVEKVDGGIKVTVGSTPHPMTEEHYIELIELVSDHCVYRRYLKPGDAPEATFCGCFDKCCTELKAREHCNVHGLWST
jgi:superoxide reductase